MPFILNALKKKFVHCFPAGNCSIIKYIRIPAGFQSDNWKTHLAGLPVQYTVHPRKRQKKKEKSHYFSMSDPPCHPCPKVENYFKRKWKQIFSTLWFLSMGSVQTERGKKWVKLITCSSVNFNLVQLLKWTEWLIYMYWSLWEKKNWLSKFPQILADRSKMWRLEIIYSHTPFLELCQMKE